MLEKIVHKIGIAGILASVVGCTTINTTTTYQNPTSVDTQILDGNNSLDSFDNLSSFADTSNTKVDDITPKIDYVTN